MILKIVGRNIVKGFFSEHSNTISPKVKRYIQFPVCS